MKSLRLSIGALALGLLAACGGDGGGGATSGATITGGVVKGPVLGSSVCAYLITNGAKGAKIDLLGTGVVNGCFVTGADGAYAFSLPAGVTSDVLIEATGGSFCANESQVTGGACAGSTLVNLGSNVMSAVVTANGGTVYTTPLTTAAVGSAGAGLTAATFNASFTTLKGGIAGIDPGVTPATAPTVANQPYLTTAAQTLAGGGSMATVVANLGGGSGSSDAAGTVNAALVGTRTLVFQAGTKPCGSLCNYVPGQTYTFIIGGDNTLKLPGGATLSNPVVRSYGGRQNDHEIIWKDTASGVEYALSDNAAGGSFSEINVFDAALPGSNEGFIGQMKTPEAPTGSTLSQIAGNYTIDYQYAGADVAWTGVTIGTDGAVTFTGTGPNVSSAQVGTVTSSINCCNRIDVMANVNINGAGAVDDDDRIMLYVDNNGALKDIEYYSGASNVSSSLRGVRLIPSGGQMTSIGSPGEGAWAIPANNGVSGTVGSTAMLNVPLAAELGFSGNATNGYFRIRAEEVVNSTLQKMWMITVNKPGVTLAVNTNYSCVHNGRDSVIDLQTGPSFSQTRSTKNGGNCNVYITRLERTGGTITAIEGRFTATAYTFKRGDADALIADGAFRYVAP